MSRGSENTLFCGSLRQGRFAQDESSSLDESRRQIPNSSRGTRLLPKETNNFVIVTVEIYQSATEIRDITLASPPGDGSTGTGSFSVKTPIRMIARRQRGDIIAPRMHAVRVTPAPILHDTKEVNPLTGSRSLYSVFSTASGSAYPSAIPHTSISSSGNSSSRATTV